MKTLFCLLALVSVSVQAPCGLVGSLASPKDKGLVTGGETWLPGGEGLKVSWIVSENADHTWHYQYTFTNRKGDPLKMDVSHFIISVSDNLTMADVFNFEGDFETASLGQYKASPSNPEFPAGQTLYGLKINMGGEQVMVSFDSVRIPMWGDFYSKGGGKPKNYAYNTDFGVVVANLHDYMGTPVDASGNALFKILVPDTIPEPATLAILGLGSLLLTPKRRFQR
jgi:hypothetical protein